MPSTLIRIVSTSFAIVIALAGPGSTQGKVASWLDEARPASWNEARATIPPAPRIEGVIDARCREAARPPQLDEDSRLRDRGWDLVGPYQGGWQTVVIRGTAGYDGMCRPRQYQDFVFVRGVFAGTLSPRAMDSRTDGALARVLLQSATALVAQYSRYSATDALCCPSRTTTVMFEIASDPPIVRPISTSASQVSGSPPADSAEANFPGGLAGTSWQLVKFQSMDDTTLTPDDRTKYTITFAADGQLSARIDCNRGHGTWRSAGPNQIEFGPLALTRAQCASGSLHDQIVKQWGNIRSYVIRDGHLFLALKLDSGIYEFEPVAKGH
jgi:heat shock protein HslJ